MQISRCKLIDCPWIEQKLQKGPKIAPAQKCLILAQCCRVGFWQSLSFIFILWDWQTSNHWHCMCTGWTQPLASPDSAHCHHVTTPGGGDLGITFLQLWCWMCGACPPVKGRLDRLARLTALSQWAVRNGRGNENQPSVCCPLPRLQGEPPGTLFWMHNSAATAVRVAVVFKVLVSLVIFRPTFASKKQELLKRSFQAQFPQLFTLGVKFKSDFSWIKPHFTPGGGYLSPAKQKVIAPSIGPWVSSGLFAGFL